MLVEPVTKLTLLDLETGEAFVCLDDMAAGKYLIKIEPFQGKNSLDLSTGKLWTIGDTCPVISLESRVVAKFLNAL